MPAKLTIALYFMQYQKFALMAVLSVSIHRAVVCVSPASSWSSPRIVARATVSEYNDSVSEWVSGSLG